MSNAPAIRGIVRMDVPFGQVITCGDISEKVWKHRRFGQAVGAAIKAHEEKRGFPWWRVVDRTWCPKQPTQKDHLLSEQVSFDPRGRTNQQHRFDLKSIEN